MKKLISRVISYFSSGKKKFFLIGFILIILSSIVWRWPVHITLPVRGQVLDAATGKPIENAVISCRWLKSLPSISGPTRSSLASEVSVTDKNGNYYIPMKITFHIISWFDEMSLSALHPLYNGKGGALYRPPWRASAVVINKGLSDISNAGKIMPGLFVKNGVIRYDVKLLSLEEKYVKAMERLGLKKGERQQNTKLEDPIYELNVRFLNIAQTGIINFKHEGEYLYDEKIIFSEWEKITDLIGRTKDLDRAKNWVLKRR